MTIEEEAKARELAENIAQNLMGCPKIQGQKLEGEVLTLYFRGADLTDELRQGIADFVQVWNYIVVCEPWISKAVHSWQSLREAELETPDDIVAGFIPGSSLVMFSGDGGIGKSYVLLEMALQIARGEPWLGMDTKQTPVLIIDLENRQWRVAHRIKYISEGWTLPEKDYNVQCLFECDATFSQDDGLLPLYDLAEEFGFGLIILDSLVDFLDELDENSNTEMAAVCKRLRQFADKTGCTVLCIHHVSKGSAAKSWQSARGASALKDNSDCSIQVVRSAGGTGDLLTMRHDKARDFNYKSIKAKLNWGPGLFNTTLFDIGDAKDSTSGDADKQAILDSLTGKEWRKRSDVQEDAQMVTNSARSTIITKVKELIDDDVILVDETPGKWGRSEGLKLAN